MPKFLSRLIDPILHFYVWATGHSYTNLGRLFLRLFIGIMMLSFSIRQIAHFYDQHTLFPSVLGMGHETSLIVMIAIEGICSIFIMAGFCMRLMILPPFIAMLIAEIYLVKDFVPAAPYLLTWQQESYLPVMFMAIFFFLLLVGPGKISVDYFLSLHILHSSDKNEEELEEV